MKRQPLPALIAFLLLVTAALSPLAAAEKTRLEEGIQYEKEGKVIHALSAYWDVMERQPIGECFEAWRRYTELSAAVKQGNPGTGEFGMFERYDKWVALAKEYEQLWNEECPFYVAVSNLKKDASDLQSRTASYSLSLQTKKTKKYTELSSLVQGGFKSIWRNDWKEMNTDWPARSVYAADSDSFEKNGVRLASSSRGSGGSLVTFNAADFWGNVSTKSINQQQQTGYGYRNSSNANTDPYGGTLYDIAIKILDERGTVLARTGRELARQSAQLSFNLADQEAIRKLDSYKIAFAVDELYLEYGDISGRKDSSRDWLRTTKEKKLAASSIRCYTEGDAELEAYEKRNLISEYETYYRTRNGKYAVGDIILADGSIVNKEKYRKNPNNKAVAIIAVISDGKDGGKKYTAYGIGTTFLLPMEKDRKVYGNSRYNTIRNEKYVPLFSIPVYYGEDGYKVGKLTVPTEEERSGAEKENSLVPRLYEDFIKDYAKIAGLPENLSTGWTGMKYSSWDVRESLISILPDYELYDWGSSSANGAAYRAFE